MQDFFAPVKITVFDNENSGNHRALGVAYADFSALCINGGCEQIFRIWNGNNSNGIVKIKSIYNINADDVDEETQGLADELKNIQEQQEEARAAIVNEVPAESESEMKMAPLVMHLDPQQCTLQADGVGFNSEGPENLMWHNDDAKYCTEYTDGFSMTWNFTKPILVRGYILRTANDRPARDPRIWSMTGTEVNIHTGEDLDHVVLDEREEEDGDCKPRFHSTRYKIARPTWVNTVTLTIHALHSGHDNVVQLGYVGFLV